MNLLGSVVIFSAPIPVRTKVLECRNSLMSRKAFLLRRPGKLDGLHVLLLFYPVGNSWILG